MMDQKVNKKSDLTKAIRSAGFSPMDFAKDILGTTYQAFRYRLKAGKLTLDQYHKIMAYTGRSFDDLWPNPYQKTKKIPLTFSNVKAPAGSVNPAPKSQDLPSSPSPAPSSFPIMDIYEDGLPPL